MVAEVLAHTGKVDENRDAGCLQLGARSDAREREQVRGLERSGSDEQDPARRILGQPCGARSFEPLREVLTDDPMPAVFSATMSAAMYAAAQHWTSHAESETTLEDVLERAVAPLVAASSGER